MKKYYLLLVAALSLFCLSLYYKHSKESLFSNFPVSRYISEKSPTKLNLFFFFSMNNCEPCLKIIEILNTLDGKYRVLGIIPEKEVAQMREVRIITNASFEIEGSDAFSRYKVNYSPTLIGANNRGDVLFIIPGVPGESEYLEKFIETFAHRAKSIL